MWQISQKELKSFSVKSLTSDKSNEDKGLLVGEEDTIQIDKPKRVKLNVDFTKDTKDRSIKKSRLCKTISTKKFTKTLSFKKT